MMPYSTKKNKRGKSLTLLWGVLLCILSIIIIMGNLMSIIYSSEKQSEELGNERLSTISTQMQKTLDNSKIMLLRFASDVEVLIERGADRKTLESYLKSQSRIFKDQSDDTFMNAYISTADWILISDSPLPDDFVITERDWYIETMKCGIDNIRISAPYLDALTGEMCFTSSLLLSDGKTIICIDFNLSKIQETVAKMNRDGSGEALIVSRNGIVVGYTDNSLAGEDINGVLPEYVSVYENLLKEHNDSVIIETDISGRKSKVYCNRSGEWLFLYRSESQVIFRQTYLWLWISLVLDLLLLGGIFIFFLSANLNRTKAEEALRNRESFLENLTSQIREPLTQIISISGGSDSPGNTDELRKIHHNAEVLSEMMNDMLSYKNVKREREAAERQNRKKDEMLTVTKRARNGIMVVIMITIVVAIVFTGLVLVNWGSDRIEREVDSYNYQLENWTNTQLQTMNMFVDTIAANPSVLDDYDFAVEYLDRIVRFYPQISAAYIARPGNAHEMTMNNGWVPNADYIVAKRQWYIDTVNSPTEMSISAPYLDARTGLYCVTFSRVVYATETKEQLGVFALDFYIGNLTSIMESSYSQKGYAFLVDNSNVIVNHPNANYQISSEKSTSVFGTEYEGLMGTGKIRLIRDYDGKLKACISRTEDITGFTVVSVKDASDIYGIVLFSGLVFIILLVVCIVLLYQLIMRLIRWQDEMRRTLTEEAERASRADRAKSSFLAQMSHEIRTPINAVLGMNEMILRESGEENIQEYANNAYSAGKALLSIINDILDISKIEAGKLEIVEADYELYSLVSDCYNLTADRAEKKGLAFSCTVDETLPAKLSGDMYHIRQIAVNLLTNAIKYTDKGCVSLMVSGEESESGFVLKISVKDTGIGLTEESKEKLFTSFQRFDLRRNQTVEGTGLGLAICKQLAELMNGTVSVESVYGEGSVFGLTVPQTVVDDSPVGQVNPLHSSRVFQTQNEKTFIAKDVRILVVDDVEMNLTVFKSLLKGRGLVIDTALSGSKCLEMVRERHYDMIFMDHMMPEMDGIETFRKMKETEGLNRETPVVMLTANAISGERDKYLSEGFASYLTKPIQSDKLEETLIAYLPREKISLQNKAPKSAAACAKIGTYSELIDRKLGLSYNAESEEVYREVLESYVKSGNEMLPKLRNYCAEEKWESYVIEVHALKGMSLTIGAKALSEKAKELEFAGKSKEYDTIKRKNTGLLEAYESVLSEGRKYLEEYVPEEENENSSPEEISEISLEKFSEYIEKIKAACLEYDSGKVGALCDEAGRHSCLGTVLKPLLDDIKASADDFECEDAAQKAQEVWEKISSAVNK